MRFLIWVQCCGYTALVTKLKSLSILRDSVDDCEFCILLRFRTDPIFKKRGLFLSAKGQRGRSSFIPHLMGCGDFSSLN